MMWNQNSMIDETSRASEKPRNLNYEAQVDSGFLSSEDQRISMRSAKASDNAELNLSGSFVRDLHLEHSSINNLETRRTQGSMAPQLSLELSDVLKESYENFLTQDDNGDTLLHWSIAMSYTKASLWLIGAAADPRLLDRTNNEWHTPLHYAVLAREPCIVRRLVLAGVELQSRTRSGNTALHLACTLGDLGCVKALTELLTVPEINWLLKYTPTRRPTPQLPQNFEIRNYTGRTCLHIAASKGFVDIVQQLVRSGAELDTEEGLAGRTALHLAVENGCRQVVHFLAQERRSCLEAVTYAGITAYEIALDVDEQLADELLRLGASPRVRLSDTESSTDDSSEDEPENS